jgi:multicomponent Na+:H+ antiporter subunit G
MTHEAMHEALRWVADVLVLVGLAAVTVSVVGILRMKGTLMRVQAAGQAVPVGIVVVLMGAVGSGQWALVGRALLVAIFLMLTAPMSAHAIAQAAAHEREKKAEGEDPS